jgi:hypothetical protein
MSGPRQRFVDLVNGLRADGEWGAIVIVHVPVPKPGHGAFAWHEAWRGELGKAMYAEGYREIAYAWHRHGRGADIAFGSNDPDDIANVIPESVKPLIAQMYPEPPDPSLIAAGFRAVFGVLAAIPGPVGAIGAAGGGIVDVVEKAAQEASPRSTS